MKHIKLFERFVNEAKMPKGLEKFAQDEIEDGFKAEIYLAFFDEDSEFDAQTTTKTWPDGVPVTKYFNRGGSETVSLSGEYYIIDSERGWYYFTDGRTWYAVDKDVYTTPPFEF